MVKPAAVDKLFVEMVQSLMEHHDDMTDTEKGFVSHMARVCEDGYGVVTPAQRQWITDLCVRYEA